MQAIPKEIALELAEPFNVSKEQISFFQKNGFIKLKNVLSPAAVAYLNEIRLGNRIHSQLLIQNLLHLIGNEIVLQTVRNEVRTICQRRMVCVVEPYFACNDAGESDYPRTKMRNK